MSGCLQCRGVEDEGDVAAPVDAETPAHQGLGGAGAAEVAEEELDDEELARRLQREMDEEALRALYAAQFSE